MLQTSELSKLDTLILCRAGVPRPAQPVVLWWPVLSHSGPQAGTGLTALARSYHTCSRRLAQSEPSELSC